MMQSDKSSKEIYESLQKLCVIIAPKNHEKAFEITRAFISKANNKYQTGIYDESTINSTIINYLQRKSPNSISYFEETFETLSCTRELKNVNSILSLLIYLKNSNNGTQSKRNFEYQDMVGLRNSNFNNTHYQLKSIYPPTEGKPSTSSSASSFRFSSNQLQRYGGRASECRLPDLENELIQDAIHSFTGIQGKYLRKDITSGAFRLDPKAKNPNTGQCGMLLRLSELGYCYNQVKSYTDKKSHKYPIGLLGQGLISFLNNELTQFYGMVAVLQEQLNRQQQLHLEIDLKEKLTLLKVMVWAVEPLHRLQWLVTIADACHEKKGGALASSIYNFMGHGDPTVKSLVKQLLCAVCSPFQTMLSKWLLDGEIEDPFSEFFIEVLPEIRSDRLWHDKYRIKEGLLPNFISKQLAQKILVTGKSVNYLREVCEDKSFIKGREDLKQCFLTNVDSLFSPVADTKLHLTIETAYLNTSKNVLDIIMGPHKLLEHLQAMRRYLLLGQGDFIGLLMENLKPELDRPAKELYRHNLSSIMDATIRATNVQFDDPDILDHLDIKLMHGYDGDVGWDIFSLTYTVGGPLSPILEPSMNKYEILFKPLWNAKHIEFVLSSKIWKEQKLNAKMLRSIQRELDLIPHYLHLTTSKMIHFIHQMQYYILFEILECSWAIFLKRINNAKALDDILEAHQYFLESVLAGIFLDDRSQPLIANLEIVYSSIIKLETWQDNFYKLCFKELNARKEFQRHIELSKTNGTYGITTERRLERDEANNIFEFTLAECQKSLTKIGTEYERAVRQFLLALESSNDIKLQLFGTRLDFNEYYKKQDERLGQPLKFEHIRMSTMYFNKSNNCNISSKNYGK